MPITLQSFNFLFDNLKQQPNAIQVEILNDVEDFVDYGVNGFLHFAFLCSICRGGSVLARSPNRLRSSLVSRAWRETASVFVSSSLSVAGSLPNSRSKTNFAACTSPSTARSTSVAIMASICSGVTERDRAARSAEIWPCPGPPLQPL